MAYIGAGISRFNTADELTVTGDAQIDTTTLVVDSTNNRVGVGTASPATALDVTGTVTADELTVEGASSTTTGITIQANTNGTNKSIDFTNTSDAKRIGIEYDNPTGKLRLVDRNENKILDIDEFNGDISFYDNTGTTQGLFWDASTQYLGLGTTSPVSNLQIVGSSFSIVRVTSANNNIAGIDFGDPDDTDIGRIRYSNVDESMRFTVNGSERAVITSDGDVGIGGEPVLSSSAYNGASLHLRQPGSTTTGGQLRFTTGASGHTASDGAFISYFTDNNLYYNNQESGAHRFYTAGSERLTITSGGSVGIGTASPAGGQLHLFNSSAGEQFISSSTSALRFVSTGGDNYIQSGTATSSSSPADLIFTNVGGTSETMRIDSSGNLLVGKTSEDATTVGSTMRPNGYFVSVSSNDKNMLLNRTGTDGTIAEFRKDGSTVGSIGAAGGNAIINSASAYGILQNAGSNQYVWSSSAGASAFYPEANNSKDLGTSTKNFKDLYLSGGAYIGGTATANHLDDFEEGTWTPTGATNSGTAATFGSESGRYQKIGRMVTVYGFVTNIDTTGCTSTSQFRISGLPFTPDTASTHGVVMVDRVALQGSRTQFICRADAANDALIIYQTGNNIAETITDHGDITSGTSDIFFTVIYQTTQ